MRIFTLFLAACLWACSQNPEPAQVTGKLTHYKGDKVYFEICSQDSILKVALDSTGSFTASLPVTESSYVRLMNGKASFPLYVKPGMKVQLEMDAEQVKEGDFESVKFPAGVAPETQMMVYYYQNQWFPSTEEMFVKTPVEFRQMMDSIIRYNDQVVDDFWAKQGGEWDRTFVDLFKIQIKVPMAASYYYYPMYHSLLNRADTSEIPEDFNFFDELLPKNDSIVYNKVYRYKVYEVSYWHNEIGARLANLSGDPEAFLNAYIDQLKALDVHRQLKDDLGNNLIMQYAQVDSQAIKDILIRRYPEIVMKASYRKQIEKALGLPPTR